ncbi:MAG: hypothetical protein KJ067_23375 [Vicinamibacteria bacterium]|nr:hypothetical protein [Vicinamibacteria bacterium]
MSSMKDLHAEVMDLLEQSVDDAGLDTCAVSGEALHAARSFVGVSGDEEIKMSAHHAGTRGVALGGGGGVPTTVVLVSLRHLAEIEVRRFAVALDASHRSHAVRVAAARELGLLIDGPRGPIPVGPWYLPIDLRAVVLEAFPLSRGLGIGHVLNEGHDGATCPEPDCVRRRTEAVA